MFAATPPPGLPAGPAPRPVQMADPDPLKRKDLTRHNQAVKGEAVRSLNRPMSNRMLR